MLRILTTAAVLATAALGATAAAAQPVAGVAAATGYYVATPVEKPAKTSFLTRETMWKWRDGAYVANRSPDRDIIVCSLVAQRAGKLSGFSVAGTPVSADMLDKCNARAR